MKPRMEYKTHNFKNPFVILPAPTELTDPNGKVTPEVLMHYKGFAQSEAALVMVGPATVTPPVSRKHSLIRIDQPKYLDGMRTLAKIIGTNGAIAGIQITHPGHAEADEILAGLTEFKGTLEEFDGNRLINMFKSGCKRSIEVGFHYLELCACHFQLLQMMVEQDQEELLKTIFSNAIKVTSEHEISGLRLDARSPNAEKYANLFLELGGDIISYDPNSETIEGPVKPQRNQQMVTLRQFMSSAAIHELANSCKLIAMPQTASFKHRQVMEFFK